MRGGPVETPTNSRVKVAIATIDNLLFPKSLIFPPPHSLSPSGAYWGRITWWDGLNGGQTYTTGKDYH